MSIPTPPINGNRTTSSFQRVAIAAGTLIVVVLTVVIALFLAAQDLPEEATATPAPTVAVIGPTATPTTPVSAPSSSPTHTPTPTDLPPATLTPSATLEATAPPPPAATDNTDTPVPPPATDTSTPVVVTPTSLPATPTVGDVCQTPPTWLAYQVQPGDTLNSLANRINSSVFELQQANCLDSTILQNGQTVYLPVIPPTPTETRIPSPTPQQTAPTPTPTPFKPRIDNVVPDRVDKVTDQEDVIITVMGRNFRSSSAGFKVELRGPQNVLLQLGEARSELSFDAIVPSDLPEGTYDVVVTNPDGRAATRESAYIIGPAPTPGPTPSRPNISNFSPKSGDISQEVILTIIGSNFQPTDSNFEVKLRKGGNDFILDLGDDRTPTSFEAVIRPGQLTETGKYDLIVINPDGQSDIADDQYEAE